MRDFARLVAVAAYRFKPARTAAQVLAAALTADGTGLLDTDWLQKVGLAGMAGLVSLLQIWSEGGDLLAEDRRVTRSALPFRRVKV